jgi:hypothetical protein
LTTFIRRGDKLVRTFRFGNDLVPVWVTMRSDMGNRTRRDPPWSPPWELEAMMDPHAVHPSGKTNLVKVNYLYIPFNGWIRKERVRPR